MSIKQQLDQLGWSAYKFWKESGLPKTTAYEVVNGKAGKAIILMSKLWLSEKIRSKRRVNNERADRSNNK